MATVPIARPQDTSADTGTRASWLARRPLLAYSADPPAGQARGAGVSARER